jgi:DamX protein
VSKSSADNINSPSYLSHYGMHRPPFAENLDKNMLFSDLAGSQRLDILTHLTQYSKELLLVIGSKGIGKSTMLHQFTKMADPTWKICQINGNALLDEEQLLLLISHKFRLPVDVTGYESTVKNLKRRLEALLATTQTVVIIIDDAHQLNDSVLGLVLELSKISHTGSGGKIRIILSAESSIQIQLATPELETHLKDQPIRKIDLPPFTEEQTQEYIHFRLSQAGISSDTTLGETAINKIHRVSGGIPSQINERAHSMLYEMTPLKNLTAQAEHSSEDPAKSRKLTRIASALVIGLALVTLLLFQNEINELYSIGDNKPSIAPSVTEKKIIHLEIPKLATSKTAKVDNSSLQGVSADYREKIDRVHIVLDQLAKLDKQTKSAKSTRTIFKKPNRQRSAKAEHPKSKTPVIKNLTNASNNKRLTRKPTGLSNIKQEPWILEQDPNYFTLQLVAGYQRSSIDHFIKLYPQLVKNLSYFASINKGKNWHSLVYGVYPTYVTAITAAKELTGVLGKHKPWIRQIKSIQKDIKS